MFVPLVVYEGGGDDAMFEPLNANIEEYEWALAQYLGILFLPLSFAKPHLLKSTDE